MHRDDGIAVPDYGRPLNRMTGQATTDAHIPQSRLQELSNRIYSACNSIAGISTSLEDHATAVFGEVPEDVEKGMCCPALPGQFGSTMMALDALESAIRRLEAAAARNTQLAN